MSNKIGRMVREVREDRHVLKDADAPAAQSQMGMLIDDMNREIGSLEAAVDQAESKFVPVLSPLSTKDSPLKDELNQPCSEVVGIFRNFMERVRACTARVEQMNDRCDL